MNVKRFEATMKVWKKRKIGAIHLESVLISVFLDLMSWLSIQIKVISLYIQNVCIVIT